MIVESSTLRSVNQGIQVLVNTGFNAVADNSLVDPMLMRTTARGQFVVLAWLASLPGMKKLRGEARKQGIRLQDYKFENFEWEDSLTIKAIDLFRDNLGMFGPVAQMLGNSGGSHPLELVGSLLVNGFSDLDYTGAAFFAANKKAWTGAVTFSNKGTKKLSAANYETAYTNITMRKNAFGAPMRLGKQLLLVVSPTNKFTAEEIVEKAKNAAGADNKYFGTAKVVVLQDLSIAGTGDEWFLLEVGLPVKPLALNIEIPFKVLADFDMTSRDYIETHEFIWQGYYSGGVGYGLPELAYGSTGADAA